MKKPALSLFIFLLSLTASFAQEIRVSPVAGANATFALNSSQVKRAIRENLNELKTSDPGVDWNNSFPASFRFQIGGLVDYSLHESWLLESGVLLHFRGRKQRLTRKGIDSDGEKVDKKVINSNLIAYLEIPLLATRKLGENGFKLTAGPAFGFALAAKQKAVMIDPEETLRESAKQTIGKNPLEHSVRPFDLSLYLGIGKEVTLAGRSLGFTCFVQPSFSKWNTSSILSSGVWSRHLTTGIRTAYYFPVR